MSHPNRIYNGDVSRDLSQWDIGGNASYVANQGNNELGAAYLANAGDSISQAFTIGVGRLYMVELAIKGASAGNVSITITNSDGDTVWSDTIEVTTSWAECPQRVGLPWGEFTLTIAYNDVAVYVDDVSIAHVIKTRAELAQVVHNRLGVLATNASVSLLPVGDGADGWYVAPIDTGLRRVGATDPAGRPDVRYLDSDTVDSAINEIELNALHKLHRYWATKTDYAIGPRQENQSQITAAIDRLIGTAVGGRAASSGRSVKQRKLTHRSYTQ